MGRANWSIRSKCLAGMLLNAVHLQIDRNILQRGLTGFITIPQIQTYALGGHSLVEPCEPKTLRTRLSPG